MQNLTEHLTLSLEQSRFDELQAILKNHAPDFLLPEPLAATPLIPDELVERLMEAGAERRVKEAVTILKELELLLMQASLPQKNAAAVMSYAAWVWASDLEPSFDAFVKTLYERFQTAISKEALTLSELIHLNFTGGLLKLREEQYDAALEHFELAERVADRSENPELQTIARYYLARAHLKRANYRQALSYVQQARAFDVRAKRAKRLAITDMLEGLIELLLGNTEQAEKLFDHAETALEGHKEENLIECGNLCLFRGRILRRRGQYVEAMNKFREGIKYYERHNPNHRNIARARVHLAHVYRLIAREQLEIKERSLQDKERVQRYHNFALEELLKAENYYEDSQGRHHQGLGKVHYTRALVYLDKGQMERARQEAGEAFRLGWEKGDNLVMAKARILQCRLALAARSYEWDTLKLAEEAVSYANRTQYPRLRARAQIWFGQARLKVLEDAASARICLNNTSEIISDEDQDDLRRVFNQLDQDIRMSTHPERVIVHLTLADLYNHIPSFEKDKGNKAVPKGSYDFWQIIDMVEERVLQQLLAHEGNTERVRDKWHVRSEKIKDMGRYWTLTEQSFLELEKKLTDEPGLLQDLAADRNYSPEERGNPAQLDALRKALLTALEPLKNEQVLGQASFLGKVKMRIGRDETQRLKRFLTGEQSLVEKSRDLAFGSDRRNNVKSKST